MTGAVKLYTWSGPALINPGAGAYQDRFNRFTTLPLASVYGNGGINVKSLQTTRRSVVVPRTPTLNALTGNGLMLHGQVWAQSLMDAEALAAKAVQG